MNNIYSDLDLGDPSTFTNGAPVEIFDNIRNKFPIAWHFSKYENKGFWVVTRDDIYQKIVLNPLLFSSEKRTVKLSDPIDDDLKRQRHFLLNMDPPKHAGYRKIMAEMFSKNNILDLKSLFRSTARDIFKNIEYGKKINVVEKLANAMPLEIISNIIGLGSLSKESKESLASAVHTILYPEEDRYLKSGKANIQSVKLFSQGLALYDLHKNGNVNSLISLLVNRRIESEILSREDFIFQFLFMYIAGYETTRSVIASAIKLLGEHPEQFSILKNDPSLISNCVEEVLRYESTHWHHCRTANKDINIAGAEIKKGDKIALLYHAINRDPSLNDCPHLFDISREKPIHRSFGHGIHLCLGAFLAREELHAFISELIVTTQSIGQAENISHAKSSFLNGYVTMDCILYK